MLLLLMFFHSFVLIRLWIFQVPHKFSCITDVMLLLSIAHIILLWIHYNHIIIYLVLADNCETARQVRAMVQSFPGRRQRHERISVIRWLSMSYTQRNPWYTQLNFTPHIDIHINYWCYLLYVQVRGYLLCTYMSMVVVFI